MFSGSQQALAADRGLNRAENPVIQLVGFRLDNEDYAIAITKIQEIILMKPITRIPQVPDFIEGLINLRGSVIPIVNLRKRFGLPPRELDDETRTIVVNVHDKTVGCIVDAVTQVMRINRDQIQPPPLGGAGGEPPVPRRPGQARRSPDDHPRHRQALRGRGAGRARRHGPGGSA